MRMTSGYGRIQKNDMKNGIAKDAEADVDPPWEANDKEDVSPTQ